MSDVVVPAYFTGLMLTLLMGMLMVDSRNTDDNRRTGARMLLLSPAWPVLAVASGCRGVAALWRMADWGGKA